MFTRSNYIIIEATPHHVIISDLGPWDRYLSVTNNAERVVDDLFRFNVLLPGVRLFYFDSMNTLDEIIVRDGKFVGFVVPHHI